MTGCRKFAPFAFVICSLVTIQLASAEDIVFDAEDPFGASPEEVKENTEKFAGGAPLKTEPELEELLKRAQLFAEGKQYRHATTLWQKVLAESGDTLVSVDGRTFWALSEAVESTIAKLPLPGLRVYRVSADAGAADILAKGKGSKESEEAAMSEVVRKYFLSSMGDDAAYELGCLALDRFDFVGASRLFTKILEEHPDPSMSVADVWLRLAVATAYIGDANTPQKAFEEIAKLSNKPDAETIESVKETLASLTGPAVDERQATKDWPLSLGGASRDGHMQKLPATVPDSSLQAVWDLRFPYGFTNSPRSDERVYIRQPGNTKRPDPLEARTALADQWKIKKWMPSSQLLMSDGRIFLKTNSCLASWDASGKAKTPHWRTVWLNAFGSDPVTKLAANKRINIPSVKPPDNATYFEQYAQFFSDRIHNSMSISNGWVFNVEGKRVGKEEDGQPFGVKGNPVNNRFLVARRERTNCLAAYEISTGKAKWHVAFRDGKLTATGSDDEIDVGTGFMSAPVPYGNLLIVPVTEGGTISLFALARETGEVVWSSYLCDEPAAGTVPGSPVGVTIAGRDAYVVCGTGVVFAVDATSGVIRYAVRYPRQWPTVANRNVGGTSMAAINGWRDDIAIPYGPLLIVMASDNYEKDAELGINGPQLFAIDRRTGAFKWRSPRDPFKTPETAATYCLGVADGGYFVAGPNVVRRYRINGGRLLWEVVFEGDGEFASGRGVLTEDAIYIPVYSNSGGTSIVTVDPSAEYMDAKDRIKSRVDIKDVWGNVSNEPLGNLYSDGEKLWAVGGNGVMALTNPQQQLAILDRQIRAGSSSALLERARVLAAGGKVDEATADLVSAFKMIQKSDGTDAAANSLFSGIGEIQLSLLQPQKALKTLRASLLKDGAAVELAGNPQSRCDEVIFASLRTIWKNKTPGSADAILGVAPLLTTGHHYDIARQALAASAAGDDKAKLLAAFEGGDATLQVILAQTLALLDKDAAKPLLTKAAASDNAEVAFSATRALANVGDQASLGLLVGLLGNEDGRWRSRSVETLRQLTGKQFEFDPFGDADSRQAAVAKWQAWVKSDGQTAALNAPLADVEPMLGRTLICYYGRDLVVEYDSDGKKRWEAEVKGPSGCHGLPNGHRLVSAYGVKNVLVEFDADGKEVWRREDLPGHPDSVRRLDNGNTLTACSNGQQVIEYRLDGEVEWEGGISSRPMDARRLAGGNTLVALAVSNKVVELNPAGEVVWEAGDLESAYSAQRLENGNTLVTLRNENTVVEINRLGEVVWSKTDLNSPFDAQRLPNGHTLIASTDGVQELNPDGEIVWQQEDDGATSVSRF